MDDEYLRAVLGCLEEAEADRFFSFFRLISPLFSFLCWLLDLRTAEGWSCCGGAEDGKICGVADGGRLKEKALGGDEGAVAAGLWLISLTAAARGRTEERKLGRVEKIRGKRRELWWCGGWLLGLISKRGESCEDGGTAEVRGGRGKAEREEMRMVNRVSQMWGSDGGGVLGSLVLGEQNPRTPGNKNSKSMGGGTAGQLF
uniref:Uncharacterized protein n=1 Tax=Populus alba TaxID=43335 RepID=A0A4U5P612_POPAL|nr:hypothetical protein D5086_0000224960 [Populus alba]